MNPDELTQHDLEQMADELEREADYRDRMEPYGGHGGGDKLRARARRLEALADQREAA